MTPLHCPCSKPGRDPTTKPAQLDNHHRVYCTRPGCMAGTGDFETEAEAVEVWNAMVVAARKVKGART